MKSVLITGGTKGIGKACAELFSQKGYKVFVIYKSDDKIAQELTQELGITCLKADITNEQAVNNAIEKIISSFGKIDVLINNAAIAQQKLFIDMSYSDWREIIDVDLSGIFNVTNRVLKTMIKNNRGVIVNISSIWGQTGASCEVAYSSAKSGIIGFTKALAKEMGLSGIRVNCVAPGIIDTTMNSVYSKEDIEEILKEIPQGRVGTAQECANLIYFLASDDSSYITGQTIGINGGWNM